ncbi:MAG: class I SAM-dependent methyltransferase [Planctomycetota bacterium]
MTEQPPRKTLLAALDRFATEGRPDGFAVDLGCGAGRDTELLLERGWRVLATDSSEDGLRRLMERPACRDAGGRLEVRCEPFSEAEIPDCDLVNASFSLPFCEPEHFGVLWSRIDRAIGPGGRFAGQLFGDRDSWSLLEDRTHLPRREALGLLDAYVLELFEEEDRPTRDAASPHKHWHVFHIVARKRAVRDPSEGKTVPADRTGARG